MKIIFDLDGTLIDNSQRSFTLYQDLILKLGGTPLTKQKYWELKRARVPTTAILEESALSANHSVAYDESYLANIESIDYLKFNSLFPFTLPTLETLKTTHQLFLVSLRHSKANAYQEVASFGLTEFFDEVIIGTGAGEPAHLKQGFFHKLVASTALVVGDTEADINAANALHWPSVAVLSGIRNKEQLTEHSPTYLLEDISPLPNLSFSSEITPDPKTSV